MLIAPVMAFMTAAAYGTVYTDATGENFDGNGHMDIVSVEVTSTASDITFKINLNGSIAAPTDWGKYVVGISKTPGVGDPNTPVGNPWGRNISMADRMEAWIGSWVDSGGGAQAWTYTGGSWGLNSSTTPTLGPNFTQFTLPLASLGLSFGDSFCFDVYTTGGGGGDSANDALANPNQTINNWQVPYQTPSGECRVYTIPEPASLSVLGLAGLGLLARRRDVRA
jgi:hypothetical protein